MVYDPNAPGKDNSIGDWQEMFLENFSVLYNVFAKNHIALDAGSTAGNHSFVELAEQPKGIETGLDEVSLYSKKVEGQTDQVFLRYPNNGTEVQLTNYQIYSLAQQQPGTFFTMLPGKVLVNFGAFVATSDFKQIFLKPGISRNIITISICASGVNPASKPMAHIIENPPGYFTTISLIQLVPGYTYFYFAMYNI